ncbi:MAG: formamidopyrimidine-DNA glycosylase [Deltaproteobacteria bacterium]|nr:formamidopyrimidine-DNA glycosylase [Deltaproteobacteria bacterium]
MPELPDITLYVEHLRLRTAGTTLLSLRLRSPFLLRTVDPPLSTAAPRRVLDVMRLGKRIVFALDGDLFLSLHLMIAGRLHWKKSGARPPGKFGLAAFDFEAGTLLLTEASAKKRAALHLVRGRAALAALDRGGLEPLDAGLPAFREVLLRESHTLKRALTDPRLFSGIGNAYSDEILHRARLSPLKLTTALSPDELSRLHAATRSVLREWTERLRAETGDAFPEKITAFREGMAVHGRYGKPCPVCGTAVQRIRYAQNEADYCPRCQTGGKLLADRSLSRLLHDDWPKTIDELEERRAGASRDLPRSPASPIAPRAAAPIAPPRPKEKRR